MGFVFLEVLSQLPVIHVSDGLFFGAGVIYCGDS